MKCSFYTTKVMAAIIIIFVTFTSCQTSTIIDLINEDTRQFYDEFDFSKTNLKKYKVNDVLFLPYTVQNPGKSYNDNFYTYNLAIEVYKRASNNCNVTINEVIIEKYQDVNFNEISKIVNKTLNFQTFDKDPSLQVGDTILIEEINDYDMKLNKKSKLKVILKVNIKENGINSTYEIPYIFETFSRTYIKQR